MTKKTPVPEEGTLPLSWPDPEPQAQVSPGADEMAAAEAAAAEAAAAEAAAAEAAAAEAAAAKAEEEAAAEAAAKAEEEAAAALAAMGAVALTPFGLETLLNEIGRRTAGGVLDEATRAFVAAEGGSIEDGPPAMFTLGGITCGSPAGPLRAALDWHMTVTRKLMEMA